MATKIDIQNKEYVFFQSINCNFDDKFKRAVKLAYKFDKLSEKLDGIIERGNHYTDNARMALALKLMMYTGIRVGNEDSAEGYMTKPHPNSKVEPKFVKTYGLTTLLREHIIVGPRKVFLSFIGKKQIENSFKLTGLLAKQVKQVLKCDLDTVFDITPYELTKFIKVHVGKNFTPKDFRTMKANMLAWEKAEEIMLRKDTPTTKKGIRAELKELYEYVSEGLNNTPSVCKKSYIDDGVENYIIENRYEI